MTIQAILHCFDREEMLYDGPSSGCPPIPRIGTQIERDGHFYTLEGLRYVYAEDVLVIHFLA